MGRNVLEKSVSLNFKGSGPLAKSATSSLCKYGAVVIWSAPVSLSSFKTGDILADFFCRAVWDMVVKSIGVILRTVFEAGARGWLRTPAEKFGEFCLLTACWNHSQEKVFQQGMAIKDVFYVVIDFRPADIGANLATICQSSWDWSECVAPSANSVLR